MWADQLKKIDSSSVHIGRYWEVHGLVNWTIKNIISRKKASDKKAVLRLVEHISNDATMQREKVILSFPTYLMYSALGEESLCRHNENQLFPDFHISHYSFSKDH